MINTREIAEEYRLSHWAQVMRERAESGLSIKAYCRQIGICGNTYFYWQRRVRTAAVEELGLSVTETPKPPERIFSEVRLAKASAEPKATEAISSGALHIEVDGMKLTASSDYPTEKLAELLRALARSC